MVSDATKSGSCFKYLPIMNFGGQAEYGIVYWDLWPHKYSCNFPRITFS